MKHLPMLLLGVGLVAGPAAQAGVDTSPNEVAEAAPKPTLVEVVGQLPARQACPDIATELPDALVKAWQEVATPGVVLVQISLKGRQIVDVTPLQGPARYFRHVRWAVRNNVHCDSGGMELRSVRLNIRFVYPGEPEATSIAGIAIENEAR